MYIKNSTAGVVFRVVFLIVCGAGIVMSLIYSGVGLYTVMSDFALISNALALVYFAYLIVARPDYERGFLRGAVTIYMIITFVVYYLMNFGIGADIAATIPLVKNILYFISPLMAFADYLIFCRKGSFTAYSPIIWAVIPVAFNIAVYFINRMGLSLVKIPYFNLMGMSLMVTLFVFLGISYLLFVADNIFAGRR